MKSVARGILGGKGLDFLDLESVQNVVIHTDGDHVRRPVRASVIASAFRAHCAS